MIKELPGVESEIGYEIAFGTLDDARAMVGRAQPPTRGVVAASAAMTRQFCSMIEDGNRSYWDDEFADATWGLRPTPPAMVLTWCMPLAWAPDAATPVAPLAMQVPLPGRSVINASQEADFRHLIAVGDRLTMTEELSAVSDLKVSFLGAGHFVTTTMTFSRDDGEVVAVMRNTIFRFDPPGAG